VKIQGEFLDSKVNGSALITFLTSGETLETNFNKNLKDGVFKHKLVFKGIEMVYAGEFVLNTEDLKKALEPPRF
jgi:hypothetical protein